MKIRAAVVGVGYLGTFHAQKYKALANGALANHLELVGVCDLNKAQADKVAADLGVQAFYDPAQLIGKVDAVSIATMTTAHYEAAKIFLKNGIHANVEKPITENSTQAKELVSLAKEKSLCLAVGHSERFNPAFRYVEERKTGLKYIELHRHAPFKLRGSDVSVIHDLTIHDIDLALALGGGSAKVLSANAGSVVTKTYDWASCTLQLDSGIRALITSSRLSSQMTRALKAVYPHQVLNANLQTGDVEILSDQLSSEGQLQLQTVNAGKGDNLMIETEAFVRAILEKKTPPISGVDGLTALQIVEEIIARTKST